jgi:hypothetical protein
MGDIGPTDNLGKRETTTVTGTTVKRLFGSSGATGNTPNRSAVQICNHDSTYSIFLKLVAVNASLPSISATDHDFKLQPGDTQVIPVGAGVDVCILNSSGASTATNYSALEIR